MGAQAAVAVVAIPPGKVPANIQSRKFENS